MKSAPDTIGYGEFEAILAELHGIPEDERKAIRARLRVMRDAGIPSVAKPGKGARVSYRFEDLWEAHLALRLEQFGMPLERVRHLIEDSDGQRRWFKLMRRCEANHSCDALAFLVPLGFHADAKNQNRLADRVIVRSDQLGEVVGLHDAGSARVYGVINLSKLARECESAFQKAG
jgi:hypothetical protein